MYETPSHYFLCAGRAEGHSPLNAFDQALLAAGIGDVNLVELSSILPPQCRRVESIMLPDAALVPTAYSRINSSEPGQTIAAAVAIAIPQDPALPGLIMEHHGIGDKEHILDRVRQMARHGMDHRQRSVSEIVSRGIEHTVERHGAAFAGVVMWNEQGQPQ